MTHFRLVKLLIISAAAFMLVSFNTSKTSNSVVAHRGAFKANQLPENSLAALLHAIKLQCTGSELDIWLTADNKLVVFHDPIFNGLNIEELPFQTLVSSGKLSNGETLPLLEDFFKVGLKDNESTQLVLEIKPSKLHQDRTIQVANKVVEMVKAFKAESKVSYISFDYNTVKHIAQTQDKAITQYLKGDKSPAELKADGISGLDYHYNVYKKFPHWIDEAKSLGLLLNVWTVNAINDLKYFMDRDFHFITTDEPELLLELERKKE